MYVTIFFLLRYLSVPMRRSAAPSQKAGGLPPLKRTKFSTPFVNRNDHSCDIVLETPSSVNEDHKVHVQNSYDGVLMSSSCILNCDTCTYHSDVLFVYISQMQRLVQAWYTISGCAAYKSGNTVVSRVSTHGRLNIASKCPLPGKHPCTTFQGATVAASVWDFDPG